ncbi:MAG: Hsp20/alpha crystallin family protein [Anaerolineales bacterium]
MFQIIRRDPFRDLMNIRSMMDRLFDNAFSTWDFEDTFVGELPLDVVENDDEYIVKASLPGMNPDDLEITYSGNTLTIKGEIKSEEEEKKGTYHLRERRYGSFARSITLPSNVKADKIEATYEAGVLKLTLPKAEEAKPKHIAVKSGQKLIEGKVADIKQKN